MKRTVAPTSRFYDEPEEIYVLIFFECDQTYDIISLRHSAWPRSISLQERTNFPLKKPIPFVVNGEIYNGVIVARGNQDFLKIKRQRLECGITKSERLNLSNISGVLNNTLNNSCDLDSSDSNESDPYEDMLPTNSEKRIKHDGNKSYNLQYVDNNENLQKQTTILKNAVSNDGLSAIMKNNIERCGPLSSGDGKLNNIADTSSELSLNSCLKGLCDTNKQIDSTLTSLNREIRRLRKSIDQCFSRSNQRQKGDNEPDELLYAINGQFVDLLKITGSRALQYTLNLARKLFTNEQLETGMLSPQKKGCRPALSPSRSTIMKSRFQSFYDIHTIYIPILIGL